MKQKQINVILLCMALLAILISVLKVTPFEVNESTYIGAIVTLLSLATTIVIGYQIYNTIEIKKDIEEQKRKYDDILSKNAEMEKKYKEQNYEMQEGFDILSSLINFHKGQGLAVCGEAFYSMHHALISSIETERTDYEWIFHYMRKFLSHFEWQTFSGGLILREDNIYYNATMGEDSGKTLQEMVNRYLEPIREDEKLIRSNSNFCKIQFEYNRVIKLLYQRMDVIIKEPMRVLTPEEEERIFGL